MYMNLEEYLRSLISRIIHETAIADLITRLFGWVPSDELWADLPQSSKKEPQSLVFSET
ncbi:MAG: hypothetical protein WA902_00855 [Thermosynechococcaceae cyanobacterium]